MRTFGKGVVLALIVAWTFNRGRKNGIGHAVGQLQLVNATAAKQLREVLSSPQGSEGGDAARWQKAPDREDD